MTYPLELSKSIIQNEEKKRGKMHTYDDDDDDDDDACVWQTKVYQ